MTRFPLLAVVAWVLAASSPATAQDKYEPLTFKKNAHKLSAKDNWSYVVSSSDKSLDGKVLRISLAAVEKNKLSFFVIFDGQAAKTYEVATGQATLLYPTLTPKGEFAVAGVGDEFPDTVRLGSVWQKNNLSFAYDANNVRTTTGYRVFATGPHVVATPAANDSCALLETFSAPSDKQSAWRWYSPRFPIALRCRERRQGGTTLVMWELFSYELGGAMKSEGRLKVGRVERQKAIDWIAAHLNAGDDPQPVDEFLFQLHSGTLESPESKLQWLAGSRRTKDGKTYRLEWKEGKFAAHELSEAEAGDVAADRVDFSTVK